MDLFTTIYEKIAAQQRLSYDDAHWLLTSAELPMLAELATMQRQHINPGNFVSFQINTSLNYTNVCETGCTFCAFARGPKSKEAYCLSVDAVLEKIEHAVALGATSILLQGGHNSSIPFDYYVALVTQTRQRFPQVLPHFFSAAEIHAMSTYFSLSATEILMRLYEAGQRSLPGGGAEILSASVRSQISPRKADVKRWLYIHEMAHHIGM